MNLKEILGESKQLIDVNEYEHTTVTLATIFLKPVGVENLYVWFVYGPHKIFYWIQGEVS